MVKLLRTDTTLDLSQKARVVRNRGRAGASYILEDEEEAPAHGPDGNKR